MFCARRQDPCGEKVGYILDHVALDFVGISIVKKLHFRQTDARDGCLRSTLVPKLSLPWGINISKKDCAFRW